jgi:catechol-2,3-dioxygenase
MPETSSSETSVPAAERRLIKPTLHHYGVNSARRDELIDWYAKVVGFEVVAASESPIPSAYVTNDGAHHRSGFFTPPSMDTTEVGTRLGVNHIAFEYEDIDDLLESWERLQGLGIVPTMATCHGISYAFYYHDPEGNMVELLADGFGDPERSLDYIKSAEYAADPMGPPVDPAKLLDDRRQGVELDELRRRTFAGEHSPATDVGPEALI